MHTIILVVECCLFLLFVVAIGCDQVRITAYAYGKIGAMSLQANDLKFKVVVNLLV